ncbi:MAG TPA: hypothetical protein VGP68_17325 [Gemmataceae bacterium]|nr:hypothetical protein [Gemmataceae bacterium]
MNALELAAKFAAYTWFKSQPGNRRRATEARKYAEKHYRLYYDVALANLGIGRLLSDVIDGREQADQNQRPAWRKTAKTIPEYCEAR